MDILSNNNPPARMTHDDSAYVGRGTTRSISNFAIQCQQTIAEHEVTKRREKCALPVGSKYTSKHGKPSDMGMVAHARKSGDRVLRTLYGQLDKIDRLEYPRSHHQKQFHDCFIRACLRTIYGDDFTPCEPALCKQFDVDAFKTEVMIVTPRRFGKTFAVAQFCAAFATGVLGKEVAIFSTGRRASKKMLDLVIRFMTPIMSDTQRIVSRNVEEVMLFDSATGKNNKICSYPSKVQVRAYILHFVLFMQVVRNGTLLATNDASTQGHQVTLHLSYLVCNCLCVGHRQFGLTCVFNRKRTTIIKRLNPGHTMVLRPLSSYC